VLEKLGIEMRKLVYMGDSDDRDVISAGKEGFFASHHYERENICLGLERMKTIKLWNLEHILRERVPCQMKAGRHGGILLEDGGCRETTSP
jgi:hypothetical protein